MTVQLYTHFYEQINTNNKILITIYDSYKNKVESNAFKRTDLSLLILLITAVDIIIIIFRGYCVFIASPTLNKTKRNSG